METNQKPRAKYAQESPELFKKLVELGGLAEKGSIEPGLAHLIKIRASQLNGCGFCLDMHVKQAKIKGERELRLHHLAVWRESQLFSPRERAALAWVELLTLLPEHGVSDDDYERAQAYFTDKELTDLTFMVTTINAWNRINVAFQNAPGSMDRAYGLDRAQLE